MQSTLLIVTGNPSDLTKQMISSDIFELNCSSTCTPQQQQGEETLVEIRNSVEQAPAPLLAWHFCTETDGLTEAPTKASGAGPT